MLGQRGFNLFLKFFGFPFPRAGLVILGNSPRPIQIPTQCPRQFGDCLGRMI